MISLRSLRLVTRRLAVIPLLLKAARGWYFVSFVGSISCCKSHCTYLKQTPNSRAFNQVILSLTIPLFNGHDTVRILHTPSAGFSEHLARRMLLFSLFVSLLGATWTFASSRPRVDRNLHFARETDGLQDIVGYLLRSSCETSH